MTTLCLDLGTRTGWAIVKDGAIIASGEWNHAPSSQRRFDGGGVRFLRFRRRLCELAQDGIEHVVVEEVRRHLGVDAAHAYGGYLAVLQTWCEDDGVTYEAVPVGQIKKHATGKGNASKDQMIAAAKAKWPDARFDSDNEVDARWLADFVIARDANV